MVFPQFCKIKVIKLALRITLTTPQKLYETCSFKKISENMGKITNFWENFFTENNNFFIFVF